MTLVRSLISSFAILFLCNLLSVKPVTLKLVIKFLIELLLLISLALFYLFPLSRGILKNLPRSLMSLLLPHTASLFIISDALLCLILQKSSIFLPLLLDLSLLLRLLFHDLFFALFALCITQSPVTLHLLL